MNTVCGSFYAFIVEAFYKDGISFYVGHELCLNLNVSHPSKEITSSTLPVLHLNVHILPKKSLGRHCLS